MEESKKNVTRQHEGTKEEVRNGKSRPEAVYLDAMGRLQSISQDVWDSQVMIPDEGYRLRNSLIECDPKLDEEGMREESYRNDSFVLKQNRKAAEIGNSIRTNKSKNAFRLCAGVSLMIGVRYVGKALVLLASNWGNRNQGPGSKGPKAS